MGADQLSRGLTSATWHAMLADDRCGTACAGPLGGINQAAHVLKFSALIRPCR